MTAREGGCDLQIQSVLPSTCIELLAMASSSEVPPPHPKYRKSEYKKINIQPFGPILRFSGVPPLQARVMAADVGITQAQLAGWAAGLSQTNDVEFAEITVFDSFDTSSDDAQLAVPGGFVDVPEADTRVWEHELFQAQHLEPHRIVMDAEMPEPPVKRRRLTGKQPPPSADLESAGLQIAETELREVKQMTAPTRRRLRRKQPPPAAYQDREVAAGSARAVGGTPRVPRPSERCSGNGVSPCVFSTTVLGHAARIQPERGQKGCVFCDDEHLDKLLRCKNGHQITKVLKDMKNLNLRQYEKCLSNLRRRRGEDFAKDFDMRVARAEKRGAPKATPRQQWESALEKRARARGELHRREKKAYDKTVLRDRMSVRRKIFLPELKGKHYTEANDEEEMSALPLDPADTALNDAGLPTAQVSDRARALEQWCKFGSWQICESCHSVRPRALQPVDLHKQANPTVKKCALCKRGDYVPKPEHVPEPLRGLQSEVIQALRPLDIDTGKYERVPYGYRVHSSMIQFLWSAASIEDKIKVLPKKRQRKRARKAFRHLMADDRSMYSTFVEKHRAFLEKHQEPTDRQRRRPLRFIEELGLECALWPHLYYDTNLCETMTRLTDERRQAARRTGLSDSSEDEQHVDGDEDDDAKVPKLKEGRHSVRRSFLNKVFSSVVGYSEEYELLHFVYDLVMWSALGGTKNSARGVPLWLALKEAPFAPSYWRVRHQALLDMQRQCGMPKLFRTRAPLERSFPYHIWILDEMAKCGKGRQELAGPETLHMAHVLKELDRGYFSGMNRRTAGRADRWWKEHLLGARDGSGTQTVVNFTSRLEFQDGKRKAATQSYHGRGTIHSHSLDFLQNMEQIGLEEKIVAVVPDKDEKPLLHGLVMDSQLDRRRSGVPPREEPSVWDPMGEVVLLQHKEEDYALHVRPYFPEAMEVTKCHEDVQQADPHNGALLRYVATYQAKFSNAFAKEWLNDEASDYSIARRVLMDNHPLEPEMWINLATFLFPQCSFGGTLVDIAAPYPGMGEKPEFVLRYEASVWRGPDMSLLEFLRKSNAKGDVIRWVKQQHTRAETADTLEEYARRCEMQRREGHRRVLRVPSSRPLLWSMARSACSLRDSGRTS